MDEARKKGSRIAFVVDRVNLVDQTSAVPRLYGIPHGVIQAGHWRRRMYEPIQVCSAQTLEKRGFFPDLPCSSWTSVTPSTKETAKLIQNMPKLTVLGLTATPFTKGLSKLYTNLVNVTTTDVLTEQGFLVPLKMYAAVAPTCAAQRSSEASGPTRKSKSAGRPSSATSCRSGRPKHSCTSVARSKPFAFPQTVDHGAELCAQFNAAGHRFRADQLPGWFGRSPPGVDRKFPQARQSDHRACFVRSVHQGF